ncbi:MAG: hypothetical protein KC800_34260, partial [Candidatus Eremiobacteraeota bacterium]|nr:hypothetical protein [Candidatus Eremiobacteraeota bacterium]
MVVGGRAGLVAVFLALLLSSCANLATQPGISLAEEFGGARSGPLLAAPLGLPDYEMVPFLGSGWSFTAGEPLRALGDSEFH